ncbi:MAG: hypothetical protein OXI15_05650 [Chromatiales bacterium]|nr:hypothetical protein [Chromatiales bacterium]
MRTSGEEERQAFAEQQRWEASIESRRSSFSQYISRTYRPLLVEANQSHRETLDPHLIDDLVYRAKLDRREESRGELPLWHLIEELLYHERYRDPEERFRDILRRKDMEGEWFSIQDFSAWIGDEIGQELFRMQKIVPDTSLELVLDAAVILTIIGAQEFPTFSNLVTYTIGVLKGYLGKVEKPTVKPGMQPPRLSVSMERLLGQFDDVDVEWTDSETRVRLKLKRDR